MPHLFTIGKIIRANSQQAASQIFGMRRRHGIGGVIFKPNIQMPEWSDAERTRLNNLAFLMDIDTGENLAEDPRIKEYYDIANDIPRRLCGIAKEFNAEANTRHVRFYNDNGLSELPHRDLRAENGWLHVHISGQSMLCANPLMTEGVRVKTYDARHEIISMQSFNGLLAQKKIEIVHLNDGEAIIFDETMLHTSAMGPRFRVITYG